MFSRYLLLLIPAVFLMAADDAPAPPDWAKKSVPEWTDSDAKQVLTDSPWAKSVTPGVVHKNQNEGNRPFGRRGGFGFPGGPYGGGGGPYGRGPYGGGPYGGGPSGGGRPYPPQNQDSTKDDAANSPPKLIVRWESAMPVREAELKSHDANAPTLEDDKHYALAVYGLPASITNGDLKRVADECKKQSALKRDGKKDIKPSSVEVLRREDGPVVLFLFPQPKNAEITKDDRRVEFDAQIKSYSINQGFYLEDMTYQGKTEL